MTARAYSRRLILTAAGSALLVVGGVAALVWARHRLLASIASLGATSESATQVAADLSDFCVSRQKQSDAARLHKDIDERLRDIQSPATVVSRLSEACRRNGATVLEIAPIVPAPTAQPRNPLTDGRRYRIVVRGSYRQIARLLDTCPRLRLPARVVELNVAPVEGPNPGDQLNAVVVVESFVSPAARPEAPKA